MSQAPAKPAKRPTLREHVERLVDPGSYLPAQHFSEGMDEVSETDGGEALIDGRPVTVGLSGHIFVRARNRRHPYVAISSGTGGLARGGRRNLGVLDTVWGMSGGPMLAEMASPAARRAGGIGHRPPFVRGLQLLHRHVRLRGAADRRLPGPDRPAGAGRRHQRAGHDGGTGRHRRAPAQRAGRHDRRHPGRGVRVDPPVPVVPALVRGRAAARHRLGPGARPKPRAGPGQAAHRRPRSTAGRSSSCGATSRPAWSPAWPGWTASRSACWPATPPSTTAPTPPMPA